MTKRTIHLRVRELAEAQGLSDLALASLARVDVRVVRRMFAGTWEDIRLTQLAKVADALNCHISDLIDESTN